MAVTVPNASFKTYFPGAIVFPAAMSNVYSPAGHGGIPNQPRAFILHTPEEPADHYPSTPHWFAQDHPAQAGSTTYFVSYTGKIYIMVPEDWGAIANGLDGKPRPSWANPGSLNWQTISVEIEGYADSIGTTLKRGSAQWKALIELIRYICNKYNIPLTREYIMGHYQLSVNRRDPGAGFPWDALMEDLQGEDMANYYTKEEVDRKVNALFINAMQNGKDIAQNTSSIKAISAAFFSHVQNHSGSFSDVQIKEAKETLARIEAQSDEIAKRLIEAAEALKDD